MNKIPRTAITDIIRSYERELVPMITLAKQYNVTRQGIYKLLKKAGVDTRKSVAGHILISCTVCNKLINRTRQKVRDSNSHFCGLECYHTWLKHGNGNPYIAHRTAGTLARKLVSSFFPLQPHHIVHHDDRNQWNNDLSNLKVFACQGDHLRYHREIEVKPLWELVKK